MNAIAAVVRPRSRAAVRARPDVLGLGIVGAVVIVLTVLAWGTWGDVGADTGYDFVAAAHVAHGGLPYTGFTYFYGPLSAYLLGFAAFVGGVTTTTFVVFGLVVTYTILALTYALARTQTGALGATLAALATAAVAFSPTNLSYVVPHSYAETLAILLALVFLLGISAAARGRSGGALVTGVAAGLIALTRPEFEVAALVAAAVWLLARRRAGLQVRPALVRIVVPAVAVPAFVYGAYLVSISPHRLLFDNLDPRATLKAGGSAIVKHQMPLTAHSFALLLGYLLLYAAGIVAVVAAGRLLDRYGRRLSPSVVVAAVAVAVLAAAAADPEAARSKLLWVFGGVPAAAVLATLVLLVRATRRDGATAERQTLLATLALLAVVGMREYSGFAFLSHIPQYADYAAPFAFVGLARLHLVDLARTRTLAVSGVAWLAVLAAVCVGLTAKDVRAQSAVVSGPGGSIRVTPAEATLYRAAVGAILTGTRPGEPILIAPQLTTLYTITDRTDPLRELSLVPGALPDRGSELRAIAELQRSGVRLALIDRHLFPEYGQTRFGASFDRVLSQWIHRNFVHTAVLHPSGGVGHEIDVWMRRKE